MKNSSSIKIIIFIVYIFSEHILCSNCFLTKSKKDTETNTSISDKLTKEDKIVFLRAQLKEISQKNEILLKENANLKENFNKKKEYILNEIRNTQIEQNWKSIKQLTDELNQVKKENQSFISFIDSVELILKEKGIEITNEEIKEKLLKRNREIEYNMEEKNYELDREKRTNIMLKAENKELENNILKKDKDIELMIEEKKNNTTLLSFYDFFDLLIRNPLFTIISLGAGSLISYVIFFLIHKKSPLISQ